MIIVSRIIHVKVDRRLNVTNKFKTKDDFQVVLLLSCFVGHPVLGPGGPGVQTVKSMDFKGFSGLNGYVLSPLGPPGKN